MFECMYQKELWYQVTFYAILLQNQIQGKLGSLFYICIEPIAITDAIYLALI